MKKINLKNLLISGLIAGSLAYGSVAYANGDCKEDKIVKDAITHKEMSAKKVEKKKEVKKAVKEVNQEMSEFQKSCMEIEKSGAYFNKLGEDIKLKYEVLDSMVSDYKIQKDKYIQNVDKMKNDLDGLIAKLKPTETSNKIEVKPVENKASKYDKIWFGAGATYLPDDKSLIYNIAADFPVDLLLVKGLGLGAGYGTSKQESNEIKTTPVSRRGIYGQGEKNILTEKNLYDIYGKIETKLLDFINKDLSLNLSAGIRLEHDSITERVAERIYKNGNKIAEENNSYSSAKDFNQFIYGSSIDVKILENLKIEAGILRAGDKTDYTLKAKLGL